MDKYITPEMVDLLFTVVVLPLLGVITNAIVGYVKSKTKNDTTKKYIGIAQDAVFTAVQSVGQTYVDSLKKEGKFTKESQEQAFKEARKTAINLMGETAHKVIAETYGDVDLWLDNKIESYVGSLK